MTPVVSVVEVDLDVRDRPNVGDLKSLERHGLTGATLNESRPPVEFRDPHRAARRLPRGPGRALIFSRHRSHTFEHEPLDALSFVGFSRVDVASRIDGDAVRAEELTWLASAVAEARQQLQRLPFDDVDLFVLSVRDVDEPLLGISREGDVPDRPRTKRVLRVERFLDELSFRRKDLNAIVHAIADI